MAVRQVSNRGGNIIGKFPSLKMGRMVAYESLIELDYLYCLDYEPAVERFEEQPLTIEYLCGGQPRRYTPDFSVRWAGRQLLVECKPEARLGTEDNQRKFAVARQWCAERGWEFCVITDRALRTGYRLQNVKLLTQYARYPILPELRASIYGLLRQASATSTLHDLLRQVQPAQTPVVWASLLHLAFHHEIVLPLEAAPISLASPIHWSRVPALEMPR
ncbi:MAG: TnsA endonuclease N-terminal domain-containing protein [Anaerolineales bacterium]|nr:TnsA endonuclease N-terminal domain-containing protein [Anaerolineales bacterium]